MTNVAVVGCAYTKFGELWTKSLRDLVAEAGIAAMDDARASHEHVDALFVGNMAGGHFAGQEHIASLSADWLGLTPKPAVRCESACASGAAALRQAYLSIKAGEYETALVVGVEKMTDVGGDHALTALMGAGDHEWETSIGLTFTGLYALLARAHMMKFGTTREQMALVSVNNHKNGKANPFAQFRNEISVEQVLNATPIADPLGILDCSPITDGAAAVLLASENAVRKFPNASPVWIAGSGQGTDSITYHNRKSLVEFPSVIHASGRALAQAGLKPSDIDVLEVHDCFSINEIVSLEDAGFVPKGEGGKFVERGGIKLDGELPTNTQGGLKSIGHPVGATGVRQIADIARVLRGDAFNKVNGARVGMAVNVGGIGASCVATVLRADGV